MAKGGNGRGNPRGPLSLGGAAEAGATQSVLQRRVQERLDELRMTPRRASLEAGLGADAVRTILNGRSRSPRGENLAALAKALDCDVGYLLGSQDQPFRSNELRVQSDRRMTGVAPLLVERRLRFGWVDIQDDENDFEYHTTGLLTLPQYLPGKQHLEILSDEHFNSVFPAGTLLHVLFVNDPGDHVAIRDGDLVILWRQRLSPENPQIGQVERTVRRVVQSSPDVVFLHTASTIPRYQDAVAWVGPNVRSDGVGPRGPVDQKGRLYEALMIEGIVLRAYVHVSGPPIMGPQVTEDEAHNYVHHAAKRD